MSQWLSAVDLHFILGLAAVLLTIGFILSLLSGKGKEESGDDLSSLLNDTLPGVQCGQCGYPGCLNYARAVASGEAPCNKCIPGGPDTTLALAQILGIEPPQDEDGDEKYFTPRTVAFIHKRPCTGCSRCKKVCPVDAIKGAIKEAHEVLTEECTGCGECVKTCPEECIELIRMEPGPMNYNWEIENVLTVTGARH